MIKSRKIITPVLFVIFILALVLLNNSVKANTNLNKEVKHDFIETTITGFDGDLSLEVGKKKPIYFNLIVYSEYDVLNNSRLKITIPIKEFGILKSEDVSSALGVKDILITNDGLNNYVTYELNAIFGGSSISLPINLTLKSGVITDKDIFNIQTDLYDSEENLLTTTINDSIYGVTNLDVLGVASNSSVSLSGDKFITIDGKEFVKAGTTEKNTFVIVKPSTDVRKRILRFPANKYVKAKLIDGWLYSEANDEYYKIIDTYSTNVPFTMEFISDTEDMKFDVKFKINYLDANNNIDYSLESYCNKTYTITNIDILKVNVVSGISLKSEVDNFTFSYIFYNSYEKDFLLDKDFYLNSYITRSDSGAVPLSITKLESTYNKPTLVKGVRLYSDYDSATNESIAQNKVYGIKTVDNVKVKTLIATNVLDYVGIDEDYFEGVVVEFDNPINIIKSKNLMLKVGTKIDAAILNTYFENCELINTNTNCIASVNDANNLFNIVSNAYTQNESYYSKPSSLIMYNEINMFQLKDVKITGNTFINEPYNYNFTFKANISSNNTIIKEAQNLNSYILLPVGTKFNGIENIKSGKFTYTSAINYKNTNQTLISIKYENTSIDKLENMYSFKLDLVNSISNISDLNNIKHFLIWDNNYKYGVTKGNSYSNGIEYSQTVRDDLNFTTNKSDLELVNKSFYFAPPLELFFQNGGKNDNNTLFINSEFESEIGGNLNYKLSINNNSLYDISKLSVIDILPHKNDLSIMPNKDGLYTKRGSEFNVRLSGKVKDVPGYTTYYSTDEVKATIEENAAANWVLESPQRSASFYENVTMVKFVMNNNYTLESKNIDDIYLDVMVEDDKNLTDDMMAYNSFIGFSNNNLSNAIESQKVGTKLYTYDIDGKIYFDKDLDSIKSLADTDLPGIEVNVKLVDNDGLLLSDLGNVLTDSNGNFTFTNAIKGGKYIFSVVDKNINKYSTLNISTEGITGNDVDSLGLATFNLDTDTRSKTINVGVKFDKVKVSSKYIDVDGNTIDTEEISYYDVFDTFSTSAKTINNFTLIEGPTNPSGTIKISDTEIVKTYKYLRNDASNVVVQHVDELGNTLISPTILDGTSKIGLAYTTSEATIEYYQLIETPTNNNGEFSASLINVIYVYQRENALNIVINYLDENNDVIKDQVIYDGSKKLGLIETIEIIDIKGYTYLGNDYIKRNNLEVTYSNNDIVINMSYDKNVSADVIVSYVDTNNNEISESTILKGSKLDNLPYVTSAKVIKGYSLKTTPTNANGYFGEKEIKVVYVYEKDIKIVQTGSILVLNALILVAVGTGLISYVIIKRKYNI